MKKMEYKTPVLEVRAYAQFENVFTLCSRTARGGCDTDIDVPPDANLTQYDAHSGSSGS